MEMEEMCEWFEALINDLIEEYENENSFYDQLYICGAIDALEELLRRVNQ